MIRQIFIIAFVTLVGFVCLQPTKVNAETGEISKFVDLAIDKKIPVAQRRSSILSAVQRLGSCTKLGDFAKTLNTPKWIGRDDVFEITILAGWVPIGLKNSDTTISIGVLPRHKKTDTCIMMRLKGKWPLESIRACLAGRLFEDIYLLEIVTVKEIGDFDLDIKQVRGSAEAG